jgi:hypothetical protein
VVFSKVFHAKPLPANSLSGRQRARIDDFSHARAEPAGRMMSIGLHPRITGNPARSDALARFIAHAQTFDDVTFMRRIDIARSFAQQVAKP